MPGGQSPHPPPPPPPPLDGLPVRVGHHCIALNPADDAFAGQGFGKRSQVDDHQVFGPGINRIAVALVWLQAALQVRFVIAREEHLSALGAAGGPVHPKVTGHEAVDLCRTWPPFHQGLQHFQGSHQMAGIIDVFSETERALGRHPLKIFEAFSNGITQVVQKKPVRKIRIIVNRQPDQLRLG